MHVFNRDGKLVGPVESPKVELTDAEWQLRLSPEQYKILRNKGTEPAFCGNLVDTKTPGVYTCAGCGLPLFSSDSKFHSGTGWPSFFQPIAEGNVVEQTDKSYGMDRTEILCGRCGGHLGHVFDDGPRPTGLRFCLNSASLNFTASDKVASLADPAADSAAAKDSARNGNATKDSGATATAVFAGGCFWCTEAAYEQLDGVKSVVSGYSGGSKATANYETVSTGTTGHAESIQITYDPTRCSYERLLDVFFEIHDPTQLNRQDNDVGTQYRSAIFYASPEQKQAAETKIKQLTAAKAFPDPIVTTLEPLKAFYPAEDYHQDYARLNPDQPYIASHSTPKVCKLREKHPEWVQKSAVAGAAK